MMDRRVGLELFRGLKLMNIPLSISKIDPIDGLIENFKFFKRSNTMAKTRKIGRSAISGRFMTVKKARKQSRTAVVETIKVDKKKK
jgi:hypothetical protein